MANTYDIGDQVRIACYKQKADGSPDGLGFHNKLTGLAGDPTVVKLWLKDGTGTVTSYLVGSGVSQLLIGGVPQVGMYYREHTTAVAGTHKYRWEGTGALVAASPDGWFQVSASVFYP